MQNSEELSLRDINLIHPIKQSKQNVETDFGDFLYWKNPIDELDIKRRETIRREVELDLRRQSLNEKQRPGTTPAAGNAHQMEVLKPIDKINEIPHMNNPSYQAESKSTDNEFNPRNLLSFSIDQVEKRGSIPKSVKEQQQSPNDNKLVVTTQFLNSHNDENFILEEKYFILPNGSKTKDLSRSIPALIINQSAINSRISESKRQSFPTTPSFAHPISNTPTNFDGNKGFIVNELQMHRSPLVEVSEMPITGINSQVPTAAPNRANFRTSTNPSPQSVSRAPSRLDPVPLGQTKLQSTFVLIDEGPKPEVKVEKITDSKKRITTWRILQLIRAMSLFVLTLIQYVPALNDPAVNALNGGGLLITVMLFSGLDVVFEIIKCWPNIFWIFWDVNKWDSVNDS